MNVDEAMIGAKSLVEESVINVSPIEEFENIMSNDDHDYQWQNIEWIKKFNAKNNVHQSFQNENHVCHLLLEKK